MGDVSVHQPPQALDGVQMRTISRDEVEFDPPPRLGQPVADQFGVMVTGVVETHGSTASPDTGPQYRLPYRAGTRSVPCRRQEKNNRGVGAAHSTIKKHKCVGATRHTVFGFSVSPGIETTVF